MNDMDYNYLMEWIQTSIYNYLGMKTCEGVSHQMKELWTYIKTKFHDNNEDLIIDNIEESPKNPLYRKDFEDAMMKLIANDSIFAQKLLEEISNVYETYNKSVINNVNGNNNQVINNIKIK